MTRPPLDTSTLRAVDENFPAVKSRGVTLLRISVDGVTQARTVEQKQALLAAAWLDDTIVAVWTGERASDVFSVSVEWLAQWRTALNVVAPDERGERA